MSAHTTLYYITQTIENKDVQSLSNLLYETQLTHKQLEHLFVLVIKSNNRSFIKTIRDFSIENYTYHNLMNDWLNDYIDEKVELSSIQLFYEDYENIVVKSSDIFKCIQKNRYDILEYLLKYKKELKYSDFEELISQKVYTIEYKTYTTYLDNDKSTYTYTKEQITRFFKLLSRKHINTEHVSYIVQDIYERFYEKDRQYISYITKQLFLLTKTKVEIPTSLDDIKERYWFNRRDIEKTIYDHNVNGLSQIIDGENTVNEEFITDKDIITFIVEKSLQYSSITIFDNISSIASMYTMFKYMNKDTPDSLLDIVINIPDIYYFNPSDSLKFIEHKKFETLSEKGDIDIDYYEKLLTEYSKEDILYVSIVNSKHHIINTDIIIYLLNFYYDYISCDTYTKQSYPLKYMLSNIDIFDVLEECIEQENTKYIDNSKPIRYLIREFMLSEKYDEKLLLILEKKDLRIELTEDITNDIQLFKSLILYLFLDKFNQNIYKLYMVEYCDVDHLILLNKRYKFMFDDYSLWAKDYVEYLMNTKYRYKDKIEKLLDVKVKDTKLNSVIGNTNISSIITMYMDDVYVCKR